MIRCFDLLLSFVGLIFLSPIFVLLALVIVLDSRGPVFFKQVRVGIKGKDFSLIKFRSMYLESEKKGTLTIGNKDDRITRVGHFIRKFKLDELPQLINVIKGDMSIVGPRPETRNFVDSYTELQRKVLSVKPGITDYASIVFRNENELLYKEPNPEESYKNHIIPKKIKLNMIYIRHRNPFQYFRIIFLTIFSIFKK